jgi:hypothetical protein
MAKRGLWGALAGNTREKQLAAELREHLTGASLRLRTGPHPYKGNEDEFVTWQTEDLTARIRALLEGTKGTPKQGILVHRLNKALESLQKDFQPDEATLAKYQPQLKKLRAAYDAVAERISDEEHDRLWQGQHKTS